MSSSRLRTSCTAAVVAAFSVVALVGDAVASDGGGATSRWFTAVGGEGWAGGPNGGHGVLLAHWRWRSPEDQLGVDAQFNTDTLRFRGSSDLPGEGLTLRFGAAGQYPTARLVTDYYRRGRRTPEREFRAGYASVTSGLSVEWSTHFLDVDATGRRWFFDRSDGTASALELPAEAWAFEPSVSYTFWRVEPDVSQWEPHRLFQRIEGAALGLALGAEFRSETRPWGARGGSFRRSDPRNEPGRPVVTFRHWAAAGGSLGRGVRLEFREEVRWGMGEDDLSRDRLGGLSPYVVRLAGLPWGSVVSGRYIAGHLDLRWAAFADHEFGAFVDGAALADPARSGDFDRFGAVAGGGLLADLRFGGWAVEARAGTAAPAAWLDRRPLVDIWLSGGRAW